MNLKLCPLNFTKGGEILGLNKRDTRDEAWDCLIKLGGFLSSVYSLGLVCYGMIIIIFFRVIILY